MKQLSKFPSRNSIRRNTHPLDSVATVFFDLVAFSRESTTKQMSEKAEEIGTALDRRLRPDYYWDEPKRENDLILTPTGDGYAITFCNDISRPDILKIVREIYYDLVLKKGLEARFGISIGSNVAFVDLNESVNLVGWGIVKARRVMDIAKTNQVLCDSSFAEAIKEDVNGLRELGTKEAKWGQKLHIYNYKQGKVGIRP